MARRNPTQTSFLAGETTPRLAARVDGEVIQNGARQLENVRVQQQGGVARDPGTQYVANVRNDLQSVLIDFIFSATVAYQIEFTDTKARFYTNEARVENPPGTPVEATSPFATADLSEIVYTQENDVLYLGSRDVHPHTLSRLSATSFSITKVAFAGGKGPLRAPNKTAVTVQPSATTGTGINLTASSALWVAGEDEGRVVRIKTGYALVTSVTSSTVAVADVKTTLVDTTATTDWALGMFSDTEGPLGITFHDGRLAYCGTKNTPDRYAISDSDAFDTFTVTTATDSDAIQDRLVSRRINTVSWALSVDGLLVIGTDGGTFTVEPTEGSLLTPTTQRSFQRSGVGAAALRPALVGTAIYFIQVGGRKLRRFERTVDTTTGTAVFNAPDVSLGAEHILRTGVTQMAYQPSPDSVLWLICSCGTLVAFTVGTEVPLIAGHRHPLGRTKATASLVESISVIPAPGLAEDQLWLAVKRVINGSTVRFVEFMRPIFQPDTRGPGPLAPTNPSLSSQTDLIDALKDAWFVQAALAFNDPKAISGMTNANPGVITATAHGFSNGDQVEITGVLGLSGGVIAPMAELNRKAYLIANITANTFELQDLEGTNVDTTAFPAYHSEGEARKMGSVFTGFSHLEGETLQVLADGAVHPDVTVASGGFTLNRAVARGVAGLGYASRVETNPVEPAGSLGSLMGKPVQIVQAAIRLFQTLGLRVGVGPDPQQFEDPIFRRGDHPMDESPPLFTGDVRVTPPSSHEEATTLFMQQDQPLPMTVLGVALKVDANED